MDIVMNTSKQFSLLLLLVVSAACSPQAESQATAEAKACTDKACFSEAFADCKPATYTTDSHMGSQARYRVLEASDGKCRVRMTYVVNPNPDWQGKSLTMLLDPGQPFESQIKQAVGSCLAHDAPGDYQCDGPLRGIVASGDTDTSSTPQAAQGHPCGDTVDEVGEPLYPLPRDGKWGYVNRAGDWVIEPRWRQAEPFSEGRAAVDDGSAGASVWGVIDRHGDYAIKPGIYSQSYDEVDGARLGTAPIKLFSQGCAAVIGRTTSDDPYFVTRDGKTWLLEGLPPTLADWDIREYGSFSGGLAWFRVMPEEFADPERFGWINPDGTVAIKPEYEGAGDFVDGLAPADSKHDHWGYINPKGELVWPRKWTLVQAHAFSDGLARISTKQDKAAYFNGTDIVLRELHFDPPRTFKTTFDGDQTYDKMPLDAAGAFVDGLAPVALSASPRPLIYMDKQGKAVFAPGLDLDMTICNKEQYPQFRHGLARLRVANKGGKCDELTRVGESDYVTYKQSHYIYIDTKGKVVFEEQFGPGD